MSSIIVNWSGQCSDHATQQELCRKLGELAEISHSYYEHPKPVLKDFNRTIEGRIMLAGDLLGDNTPISRVLKSAQRKSHEPHSTDLFVLQAARLYGIEFRLYDGRKLYPGEDKLSFVFLNSDDYPALNGMMVLAEDREACKNYFNPLIKDADLYLRQPFIHLRYYCEAWIDLLLGWVKSFYINNLNYCHHVPLSGYDEFLKLVEKTGAGPASEDLLLKWLKHQFKEEVESWSDRAKEARAFWASANNTLEEDP